MRKHLTTAFAILSTPAARAPDRPSSPESPEWRAGELNHEKGVGWPAVTPLRAHRR